MVEAQLSKARLFRIFSLKISTLNWYSECRSANWTKGCWRNQLCSSIFRMYNVSRPSAAPWGADRAQHPENPMIWRIEHGGLFRGVGKDGRGRWCEWWGDYKVTALQVCACSLARGWVDACCLARERALCVHVSVAEQRSAIGIFKHDGAMTE